jgi:hypothetical protein
MRAEDVQRRKPYEVGVDTLLSLEGLPSIGPSFQLPVRSSSPASAMHSSQYSTSLPSEAYADYGMSELNYQQVDYQQQQQQSDYKIPTQA